MPRLETGEEVQVQSMGPAISLAQRQFGFFLSQAIALEIVLANQAHVIGRVESATATHSKQDILSRIRRHRY
jgi:hypothetical protein